MSKVLKFKKPNSNTFLKYRKTNYITFSNFINDCLEKDLIENTDVSGSGQVNEDGPFPSAQDSNRIFISWFGDNPETPKEICRLGYIEIVSENEVRCLLLESILDNLHK